MSLILVLCYLRIQFQRCKDHFLPFTFGEPANSHIGAFCQRIRLSVTTGSDGGDGSGVMRVWG